MTVILIISNKMQGMLTNQSARVLSVFERKSHHHSISVSGRWGMSQGMRADARAVCIPGGTPVMRGPPQGRHLPTCWHSIAMYRGFFDVAKR